MGNDLKVNMNEYLPLRDVVFNTLRQAILKGELAPGERLMEIQLAERLGVSRAAIWKAVQSLREEGHGISAGSNRGYCLLPESDVLSRAGISPYLKSPLAPQMLTVLQECESTSDLAGQLARSGAPAGTAVLAGHQTRGKGRRGKSFYSPPGGLYLSMVLQPSLPVSENSFLTIAAAVAVCRGVREVCNLELSIKWVNDLFWKGNKVGGILTEATADLEGGTLQNAVVGVGLNIWFQDPLPSELDGVATALYVKKPAGELRCRLAAAILNQLYALEEAPKTALNEYRALSFLPGHRIQVLTGKRTGPAKALAITDEGCLLVEYPDGRRDALASGEVRILP